MTVAFQGGENLTVDQGGKELIALDGCVLRLGLGVNRMDIQPRAAYSQNLPGLRAAVRAAGKVDVDLRGLHLASGGLGKVLFRRRGVDLECFSSSVTETAVRSCAWRIVG